MKKYIIHGFPKAAPIFLDYSLLIISIDFIIEKNFGNFSGSEGHSRNGIVISYSYFR